MSGLIGYNTTFEYSSDDVTYTAVSELEDVTPPEVEVADVKVTHLQSTGAAHEYISGLVEGGEVDFKCLFDKTRHATLYGFLRTTKYWRITLPDGTSQGTTIKFRGHIKKIGSPTPMEDKVESTVKIKVTGKPTVTAGT